MHTYTLGIDYGTASVRTILANAHTGEQLAASVFEYPRFAKGLYCDPARKQYRQHPLDYLEGLEATVSGALTAGPEGCAEKVVALSIDTTGSTPVAVDAAGIPLSLKPEFAEDPEAMFYLWKDHTSIAEAEAINAHAATWDVDYLQDVGGIYSTEWYWAKALHALRERGGDSALLCDPKVFAKTCFTFVEHCDWLPFLLTGGTDARNIKRGVCAAGHKGLWSQRWGGWPSGDFFASLDPLLAGFAQRLNPKTYTADQAAGTLCAEWAAKLGLPETVLVGIGALDAHVGAVGGQIRPGYLTKVMGTSTCDMLVARPDASGQAQYVPGISGQVHGSILPGYVGYEAGQSAFGDVFAWFEQLISWGRSEEERDNVLQRLGEAAAQLEVTPDSEIALEWLNGRRTPDNDPHLTGPLARLTLGSDAPRVYRALVEATCFGARAIVERFRESGVAIAGITGVGGVAQKSPYIMQTMADVLGMPIEVHASEQTCAAGAAMFAAAVAGVHPTVEAAMQVMGAGFAKAYQPKEAMATVYRERYAQYQALAAG